MSARQQRQVVIKRILERLVSAYAPEKVILFGSQVSATCDPDSDIDLLIIKKTPHRFLDRWVEVQRLLTGTHPAVAVDTLVLTPAEIEERLAAGDQFISSVVDEGEVLYAAQ
jgi:predicted nucleotidyltransferase